MTLKLTKLTAGEEKKLIPTTIPLAPPVPSVIIEPPKDLIKIEPRTPTPFVTVQKKKEVIISDGKDTTDHTNLRHGREVHEGTDYSMFLQSPPMLYTRDGHNLWLGDMYRGSSAFLICNGPSFGKILTTEFDFKGSKRTGKEILSYPGFVSMGMNNGPKSFRPTMWTCVDSPKHFIKSIWLDPKIMKFVPFSFTDRTLFDSVKWADMTTTVGECPNVVYYKRNEKFKADQYLFEDTFNWGNHKNFGGGRSVMLVAVRMLFHLGIRNLFILGADLKMDETHKYHFEQDRTKGSIGGNNSTYQMLKDRFKELKPIFDQYKFKVYNCNLDSELNAFPKIQFQDAIEIAAKSMPQIETERTEGLYEREANARNDVKANKNVVNGASKYTEEERVIAKKKLDDARAVLHSFKEQAKTDLSDGMKNKVIEARKVFRQLEDEKNKIWGIIKKQ